MHQHQLVDGCKDGVPVGIPVCTRKRFGVELGTRVILADEVVALVKNLKLRDLDRDIFPLCSALLSAVFGKHGFVGDACKSGVEFRNHPEIR